MYKEKFIQDEYTYTNIHQIYVQMVYVHRIYVHMEDSVL